MYTKLQGANRPVKLDTALQTVTTNAYNAGKEFWAEVWGHYLSRRIYQEILAINNANQKKIIELIQQLQKQVQELQE
ncbi:unnamed protein product [Rhizophagus irregularis]|uniref:Uncharacterized protein n=1 Tax=Rhizophagus irregularis TaxID=588596 RepID=A0A915ZAG4_9GLOM|nr:unnamed protein product [Rhizophagus irregularis]